MNLYNIHIYREMRLKFEGIEAESSGAAAAIARDKATSDAAEIDECDGVTLAALVDLVGDDEYEHSVTIDFEQELALKAAPKLLDALRWVTCCPCIDGPVGTTAYIISDARMAQARAAVAVAQAAGMKPMPPAIDVHAVLSARRQIAAIWAVEHVKAVRPRLTDGQAWDVLRTAERRHDPLLGINCSVLASHADDLFPPPEPPGGPATSPDA